MPLDRFERILRALPVGPHTVSLQGEGEPLVHPHFWEMAEQVRCAGFVPYTITNGSRIDASRSSVMFPVIGISLDTLDAREAERIGRRHLGRVLGNFEAMVDAMGADRIVVHTVNFGQDIRPLRNYLARIGIRRHLIQPLQGKDDYRQRYPSLAVASPQPDKIAPCRHLQAPFMRYFTVDGVDLPCSYIKDASVYRSDEALRSEFSSGVVPAACNGCREIGRFTL